MLDVPEGLVGSVLLVLRSLWGCWGEAVGPRHCGVSLGCSTVLLTLLGFRPSPATKRFSIMLEGEEPPVGTRFSWGQEDQLGMGATLGWWHLSQGSDSSLWPLTASESSPRKKMSL